MPAVHRADRGGTWWADFRFQGKRVRKRSPVQTKKGAEEYERQLRVELLSAGPGGPKPKPPRFDEFVRRWMSDYVSVHVRPTGYRDRRIMLDTHLLPAFGALTLDQITAARIDAFKAEKTRQGRAPKTINNLLSALRSLLVKAVDWGCLEHVPKVTWLRVPDQGFDYLSDEEVAKLLRVAPEFWRVLVLFLLSTGARFGEAAALRWEDLTLDGPMPSVLIRRGVCRGVVAATKTGKVRSVPLTPDLVAALKAFRHEQEYVFLHPRTGQFLKSDGTAKHLTKFCRRAGIKVVSWHKLRHTAATLLVARGAPLPAVQEILGHSSILMTRRYSHVAPVTLYRSAMLLDGLGQSRAEVGPLMVPSPIEEQNAEPMAWPTVAAEVAQPSERPAYSAGLSVT